ncbi:MAG TPA: DUF4396 domain-containing protein, partial [Actinomycetes bacterium]|nr:DUF4396 domain-containing protein [Actinomycetes bacterium]
MIVDDRILVSWFVLAALSTLYVAWDNFVRKNPEEPVMKWGWVLITLYMGPIALALYVLADKEPSPGTHEEFIKPLWKQGVGSTVHCIAGDATGIIAAAVVTAALGLPMWVDLIVEYAAGFGFGLFVFQALFMKNMMGGSYRKALRRSFIPEWLSMNMMAAGMFPVMALVMMGRDMRAMEPTEPLFWAVMSLGVIVGFAVAYPVNVWMVARNLKHGLMTARPPQAQKLEAPRAVALVGAHSGGHGPDSSGGNGHDPAAGSGHGHTGMQDGPPEVTRPQLGVVTLLTVLALAAGVLIPAQRVNLALSAEDVGGVIMPPGMVMTKDTPAAAMREMAAVNPDEVSFTASPQARGDQILQPRLDGNVKVFSLEASVIRWS